MLLDFIRVTELLGPDSKSTLFGPPLPLPALFFVAPPYFLLGMVIPRCFLSISDRFVEMTARLPNMLGWPVLTPEIDS